MLRISDDRSNAETSQPHPQFVNTTGTGTTYLSAQYQRILGPSGLNTVRVAWNRTGRHDDMVPTVERPGGAQLHGRPALRIDQHHRAVDGGIDGLRADQVPARISSRCRTPSRGSADRTCGSWARTGSTTASAGTGPRGTAASSGSGISRSSSRSDARRARRRTGSPATCRVPIRNATCASRYAAFFAQDDWQLGNRVSLNLGLRYEFVSTPTERDGLIAGLVQVRGSRIGTGRRHAWRTALRQPVLSQRRTRGSASRGTSPGTGGRSCAGGTACSTSR